MEWIFALIFAGIFTIPMRVDKGPMYLQVLGMAAAGILASIIVADATDWLLKRGKENTDSRRLCSHCGRKLNKSQIICPHCYKDLVVNCPHCGEIIDLRNNTDSSKVDCYYCGESFSLKQQN